jgi:murein L,D-transpeptidase YcbB/YkuD
MRRSNTVILWAHLLLCFSLVACSSVVADPVGNQLQQSLQPELAKPEPLKVDARNMPRAMAEFYAARAWAPVWDDARFAILLDEIGKLGGDGLEPEDYGYSRLKQYQAVGSDTARAGEREQLATRAYLLALVHLYRGKVDPVKLDAHWNFDKRPLDPEQGLSLAREAVEQNRIHEIFQRVRPAFQQYEASRKALASFRTLVASGGWPVVPAGPVLKPGMSDPRVPVLRQRLEMAGLIAPVKPAQPNLYEQALVKAMQRFQLESYVDTDGVIGPGSLRELNIPAQQRVGQLRANLERMRWYQTQHKDDFVLVDIAGFRIYYMHDNKPLWKSRVQIGKAFRQTPIFESEASYVTLNPTWTIPSTILREDSLPAIRRSLDYFSKNRIRVFDASGKELDPKTVDWNSPGKVTLRQDAGPGNSLGQVVIRFPNEYSVYMHDTPHQDLFSSRQRAFSSGCIRVQNVRDLAVLLLDDPQNWSREQLDAFIATNKTKTLTLQHKIPVLIAYWTVNVGEDGYVSFKQDIYGQDALILKALEEKGSDAAGAR